MPVTTTKTPWLTPLEAADYLGVALGTVRNWVYRRRIPFARRGRVVRFHRDRLDAWLASGTGNAGVKSEEEPLDRLAP